MMQYRKDKNGNELSMLGYGCMRFSRKAGRTDIEKTEKEILEAYNAGVNYYDTAYVYPGSEETLGLILERNNLRDKVNITTKLPQYLVKSRASLDKYFDEQLKRLRTDHVDYYLMHCLTDIAMWEKLKKVGVPDWIDEKKKSGAIRNIGFSYHGNTEGFIEILNDYDWDICQIQYNYYDEYTQAGREGLKTAGKKGVPVVIMEPLRGGKLVNMLPDEAKKVMEKSNRDWTPAEWAFRWLYDQPEVTVVLSGMNSLEMVQENCRVAGEAEAGHFTQEDFDTISEAARKIREKEKVGCTGCRYCMPCPRGVDIPGTFASYNTMYIESKTDGWEQYFQTVILRKEPAFVSQCVECGKCEQHCPQNIQIRQKLKEADKALSPLPVKLFYKAGRKFMFRKAKE